MEGKIKQYRPNYFSGYENQIESFNSFEQLLNIDFVKKFSNHNNFYRYSLALGESYEDNNTLMAEYENGSVWWVVGFIDKKTLIYELPIFNPKEE